MNYDAYKHQIEWISDTLVEWSKENTAGLPMTSLNIKLMVMDVEEYYGSGWVPTNEIVEEFMETHSEGRGYLVKASDVLSAFNKYEKEIKLKQ